MASVARERVLKKRAAHNHFYNLMLSSESLAVFIHPGSLSMTRGTCLRLDVGR